MIVTINRSSIKKNPNAGNTRLYGPSRQGIDFEIKGQWPDILKDGENCYIKSETWGEEKTYHGSLFNDDLVHELLTKKGLSIKISNNIQREYYNIRPEESHLFTYNPFEIKCEACGKSSHPQDIETDYDDEGYRYIVCPKCKEINSFEKVTYEKIEDVLKNEPAN